MIRVAVIGVGSLGQNHARVYHELAEAELVGVCDIDEEKGSRVAAALGTRFFPHPEDLVGQADAASVAVPTVHHAELGVMLLQAGMHVLVEKPIAATRDQAQAMIRAAEASGAVLHVGHLERFNPAVVALAGRVTTPRFFEGHRLSVFVPRSLDIDVVLDLMIHDLDLVLSFNASSIVQIHAIGIPILTDKIDIANVRIEFAGGCVANLTASRVSDEKVRKLRFFQPDAYVSMDFLAQQTEFVALEQGAGIFGKEIVRSRLEAPKVEPLKAEIQAFLGWIKGRRTSFCSGQEGLRALDTALRVLDVMKTN